MFEKVQRASVISAVLLSSLLIWRVGLSATAAENKLTVYSGREEKIIGPLIEKARKELGMDIEVRYGDSNELAIALLEEGKNSRADVFYAQDVGSLGVIAKEQLTQSLPSTILSQVDKRFQSSSGQWIGISGRVRVIDYNTKLVPANQLPSSVIQLTDPKWKNKVGWAPTNGSFQSFVSAMRILEGDQKTMAWLKGMKANGAKSYKGNSAIVEALGKGEVALGLVNNYYVFRYKKTDPNFPVAIHHTRGDAGSLINTAGMAILKTTDQKQDAEAFVAFMLKPETQKFLTQQFYEYPLVKGIPVAQNQVPLNKLQQPNIDLSQLWDLKGTVSMIQDAGLL